MKSKILTSLLVAAMLIAIPGLIGLSAMAAESLDEDECCCIIYTGEPMVRWGSCSLGGSHQTYGSRTEPRTESQMSDWGTGWVYLGAIPYKDTGGGYDQAGLYGKRSGNKVKTRVSGLAGTIHKDPQVSGKTNDFPGHFSSANPETSWVDVRNDKSATFSGIAYIRAGK